MSQQLLEGYEVSPQQKHVWTLGGCAPYLTQGTILIEGALDQGVLKEALRQLLDRHEILRTSFEAHSDPATPLQIINDSAEVWFDECNLNGVCAETQKYMLDYLVRDTEQRHFGRGSSCRPHFSQIRLTPEKHLLVVTLPALYADTAALAILMRDLGQCYAACLNNEARGEVSIQYADLCSWQNELLTDPDSAIGIDHWRRQQDSPQLRLPFENDATEFDPVTFTSVIPAETVRQLGEIGSLSSCLLAAYFVLLARLTEQSRLSVGVSFNGRNYEELVEALGLFARFLPINAAVGGDFIALLAAVDEQLAAAEQWQELYVAEGTAAFCFAYEAEAQPQWQVREDLQFRLVQSRAYVSRFKVWLRCLRQAEGTVVAEWHYDSNCYEEAQLKRLAEGWARALESIAAAAGKLQLAAVPVVGASEEAALLDYSRGEEVAWEGPASVHERFAAQAARTPEGVAVVYEEEQLTYGELNERANQLARRLRGRGVGPEQRVALLLERSLAMVVGLLGILKAGGAYVPLEPSQPAERLRRIVEDAGVRVVVSVSALRGVVEALEVAETVYLEDEEELSEAENDEVAVAGENAAYVIYTSGSTGTPKGVCVEHRQLNNYVNSISKKLDLPQGSGFALVSTFAADLGNTVIFPALCSGGTLHVMSNDRISDPGALARYFAAHTIDCLKIVPSHLSALLTHSQPELVLPRKCLVLGGEASTPELIDQIQTAAPQCRILNHYGPTETTVGVLTFPVRRKSPKTIPVGGPIANTETYILDQSLNIVPFGVAGELYIGGANLSRGYLSGAGTAAEKFVPNPFSKHEGARLYRTGDLARYLPDGNIEFLGRADDQTKVRGFRVEPGEIETVISRHEAVAHVKVLPHDSEDGKRRLVAYVVPAEDRAATVRQWLRFERDGKLQRRQSYQLPNGMVIASQNKNETDFMYREIFEDKIYVKRGIKLKPGACVFDVGANIGMFSLFAGRAHHDLKIYAFEPIPSLYELLKANLALYKLKANVFNYALGSKQELQEFTYYPHLTLLSGRFANPAQDQEVVKLFELNRVNTNVRDEQLLDEVLSERLTGQTLTCKTKRLSDVISEHAIERIDLLKIDVQKSELEVLQGIDEKDWSKIEQIVLEVHCIDGRLAQITALLEAHGFEVAMRQEAMLKKTGMYDLYCVRPNAQHETDEVAEHTEVLPEWTNPDALIADVRTYLQRELPEYMIPSAFVMLDSLPLTPNGKIDRGALPEPFEASGAADVKMVRPRNADEEVLAEIWRQVLGLKEVSVEENFFALGGDSILSIQIVA
ncbi:MAG TPA: amino acid adenylation domain-containing protein, partial [Pyrinomonadaceae bacterium]